MTTPSNESAPFPPPSATNAGRVRAKLRELFGVDLRSLALLRIGLGAAVLADLATRAFDLVELYTDRGVLPRDLLVALDGRGVYLSAHYWASVHPVAQGVLFAITALCAVALLVGWRTRIATLACWYLVASIQIRQPLVYMGGDSILRLLLFWAMFLPLSSRFSLDDVQRRVRPRPDHFLSGATVALLFQICLIYWATGVRKQGELWWSGRAIFHALHLQEWVTPLGVWLRQFRAMLEPMTYATLGLELFGPFLAFVPIYTPAFRLATVTIFWAFHLGLASVLNVGLFPLFSMVAWLAFVPSQAWTWCGSTTRTAPGASRDWRSRVASIAAVICLAYVILLLAQRSQVIPRVLPGPVIAVGTALRLQQTWNMFAPDPPPVTTSHDIRKTMADGSQETERAGTSFRWIVYLGHAGAPRAADHPLSLSLHRFALQHCENTESGYARRVERVDVFVHQREIQDDGLGEPRTRLLISEPCPAREGP
jgi:hypothetical protein